MADITMCAADNCPCKETCYRFTANPCEHWQSYFCEQPGHYEVTDDITSWVCEHYWKCIDKSTKRRLDIQLED